MNNQELVKYIFELAYEHWLVTLLFLIVMCPWNVVRIRYKGTEDNWRYPTKPTYCQRPQIIERENQ